ncbi:MAG: hypothetical protein MR536_09790 [Prevotella sp.]|nr:hypothetical protein [Prevotella sp.]MDY3853045.1 hypothetical protein [Prevotella sp.]
MKWSGFLLLSLFLFTACFRQERDKAVRAAYYWSTRFETDSVKEEFYRQHEVRRLYVRYFDVVKDKEGNVMPNATVEWATQPASNMEIIPTIFIVNNCMHEADTSLARKIWQRIGQMNKTHGVKGVKEVQIDCDWTRSTQNNYYNFLRQLRSLATHLGVKVSATIRLHQLAYMPPPVDKGTLMVYNTGDFTKMGEENPILGVNDVKPYLRHLKSYSLPLTAAYPIYSWKLLFRDGRFVSIVHREGQHPTLPTDSILERTSVLDEIIATKNAINRVRPAIHQEIILFDISRQNITRFTPQAYEKIYHP